MDDSLSDLEADELLSIYESDSDLDQDEATAHPASGAQQRRSTAKGESESSSGAEISTSAADPDPDPGPSTARFWISNPEPELDAGPARPPPDYSTAIANREEEQRQARLQHQRSLREDGFNSRHIAPTFDSEHPLVRNGLLGDGSGGQTSQVTASDQRGIESRPILESAEPETLPADEEDRDLVNWVEEKLSYARVRGRYGKLSRRLLLMVILCVFFAGAVVLGMFWEDRFAGRWRLNSPLEVGPASQLKAKLQHPALSGCEWTTYRSTPSFAVEFYNVPPHNFTFIENLTHLLEGVRLSGKVHITHAGRDQQDSIRVTIEAATSFGLEAVSVPYDARPGHVVELLAPELKGRRQRGCVDLAVKIELQPQLLAEIMVNTTSLDIEPDGSELFDDQYDKWSQTTTWGMKIENSTFLTKQGEIHGTGWASYWTAITTGNGPVTGVWPLRRALDVNTQSGDIDISIVPQNRSFWAYSWTRGNSLDTWISSYRAASVDGTIRTDLVSENEEADVPSHDYQTEVSTVNGDVYGDYLLGTNASFRTENGTMNIRIVPLLSTATNATLYTENGFGFSNVWIIDPIPESDFHPKGNLSAFEKAVSGSLVAEHSSQSGAARFITPPSWSGTAVLESESGRIYELHEDFEMLENKTHQVTARQGDGAGSVKIRTTTGDILLISEDG